MSEHTLTYLRPATVEKDGKKGLLYRHVHAGGQQNLIFQKLSHADRWLKAIARAEALYP